MTLEEIFYTSNHKSDKWQPYFEIYERHLNRFVGQPITMVEIGVQGGGSLDMWSKYLGPQAKIIGIDVDPACATLQYNNKSIEICIGDQGDKLFWQQFFQTVGKVDVILDDGGHTMYQQIMSFECAFPNVKDNGVYICEDCHTSYWDEYGGGLHRPGTFIEYSKTYIDVMNYDWARIQDNEFDRRYTLATGLSQINFYNSVVVFEKCYQKPMQRVFSRTENDNSNRSLWVYRK